MRALIGMKVFSCTRGPLADISPLEGMPLTRLNRDIHGSRLDAGQGHAAQAIRPLGLPGSV